jgi:hypothetical protein
MAENQPLRSSQSRSLSSSFKRRLDIQSKQRLLPMEVKNKKFRQTVEIWIDIENHLDNFCDLVSVLVPNRKQIHLVYRAGVGARKWEETYSNDFSHHPIPSDKSEIKNLADCFIHQCIMENSQDHNVILLATVDKYGKAIQECLLHSNTRQFAAVEMYSHDLDPALVNCLLRQGPDKTYEGLKDFFDEANKGRDYYSKFIE